MFHDIFRKTYLIFGSYFIGQFCLQNPHYLQLEFVGLLLIVVG